MRVATIGERWRFAGVWAALYLCAAGGAAQAPVQPSAPPETQDVPGLGRREPVAVLKSQSRLVVLDVIVTGDKNRPVRGLTQSDFTLLEDGVAQRLTGFEEHTMADPQESAKRMAAVKLPPNTFSDDPPAISESNCILIVLEGDTMRVREDMLVYMKTVPAGTRIAIAELDTYGLHLMQGFSSDPSELRQAVESKRIYPKMQLHLTQEEAQALVANAVQQLTAYLSGYPGRKSVIWFGPGTGATGLSLRSEFADHMSFLDDLQRTSSVLRLNQIAVYAMQPGIEGSFLEEMQRTTGTLTLNRTSQIEQIEQSGVGDPAQPRAQVPLNQMNQIAASGSLELNQAAIQQRLRQSGGDFIYNSNGIKDVIEKSALGAWNYYTLSYSPSNRVFDGRYRRLQVEISGRKVDLQYRRGYVARSTSALADPQPPPVAAPPALGEGSATMTSIDAAMLLGAPAPKDVLFTAHIDAAKSASRASAATPLPQFNFLTANYRKKSYREYRIRYTVDADSLHPVQDADGIYHVRLDLVAMVYDNLGNPVNSLVDRTSQDMTSQYYRQALQHGIELTQIIAVPKVGPAKGFFFLRLGVHDVLRDKSGALEIAVDQVKLGLPAGPLRH